MIPPFHLSFVVSNKQDAKKFYINALGCSLGRDNENWFDIIFFGHQLTIHQSSVNMPAYKIDHFGPILNKNKWLSVIDSCEENGIDFVMKPTVKDQGLQTESGKFLINDPSGNLLEFKYYLNFKETVG